MTTPEENFKNLKLELPAAPTPQALYKTCVIAGSLVYVSGHGPYLADGGYMTGKIGAEVDLETGVKAARQTALAILATLRGALGSLDRVKRVIKLLGMVNCTEDFQKHPQVIDGCIELFAQVWGEENGIGVRSAVGMNSLPINIPVEIEAVFELQD